MIGLPRDREAVIADSRVGNGFLSLLLFPLCSGSGILTGEPESNRCCESDGEAGFAQSGLKRPLQREFPTGNVGSWNDWRLNNRAQCRLSASDRRGLCRDERVS